MDIIADATVDLLRKLGISCSMPYTTIILLTVADDLVDTGVSHA